MGVCNCSLLCCMLLYVYSSIAIILMGKRERIALLNVSSWCLVMVEWLFLAVPCGCLRFVIVVFSDRTHLQFLITANRLNLCSYLPHLSTVSTLTRSTKFKDFHGSNRLTHFYIFVILCGNSCDIETNPGPDSTNGTSHYHCGVCEESVGWEDRWICCDTCNIWYHIDCQGMSTTMFSILNKFSGKDIVWEYIKCGMPNFSTTLFDTSTSLDTQNRFHSLSCLSHPESPVPDNIGPTLQLLWLKYRIRMKLGQRQPRLS